MFLNIYYVLIYFYRDISDLRFNRNIFGFGCERDIIYNFI